MDLRSAYPYWMLKHGIIKSYPSLTENIHTDAVVIGGGITGALVAWHLCNAGFETVVVDKRHIGMGSTAASTAMLQYEIDVPLHKLMQLTDEQTANESYKVSYQSILNIKDIASKLNTDIEFKMRPSLQFASFKKDVPGMQKEIALRKKIGIKTEWFDEKVLRKTFGIEKGGAIFSTRAAQVDPYAFTHALIVQSMRKGTRVYDHTQIEKISYAPRGVTLLTADKKTIRSRYIVIACGYESQKYIPRKVQELKTTYATISEPLNRNDLWYKNALIWETATPYIYCRVTGDNRVILGGEDDNKQPSARDKALSLKTRLLKETFNKLFPHIAFKPDFKWAGYFASTKDGLPYIGTIPQRPHTYFALGFGGNGITFSVIAAQIIRDMLTGKNNDHEKLFSFNR
ncbi:MAG: FAD-binding oxidoreductase [Chitinophagaceae bacterium]|nr:FAD-binding oxidoreductase [Chitinophagaceae bacterium]